jgi:YebC/PmpR family DNA-binding regulatory protein
MAGHSKWANTKYRKERQDKKRSGIFAKLIREITLHARSGDPDPAHNAALAQAIERAKAANLPKDNIEKAIKRATGDLDGMILEEAMYEGYAQDGVAVLIRVVTDNRNRAAAGIRHVFSKHGGSMAAAGSVAWQFERRGTVVIEELPDDLDRDELLMTLIESGVEDLNEDGDVIEAYCDPSDLQSLAETVRGLGVSPTRSEVTMVPKSTVHVEGQTAQKLLRLLDALDDNEDVQQVFANFDIPDEVLAEAA